VCRMAMPLKPGKVGVEEAVETVHRIRITLSSKNVKNLEKGQLRFVLEHCCVDTVRFQHVPGMVKVVMDILALARNRIPPLQAIWNMTNLLLLVRVGFLCYHAQG
jgi:hypothetical protein